MEAVWVGYILLAAGTAVQVDAQVQEERGRRRQLRLELKNAEIAAIDQENERLKALTLANSEIIAGAGGVSPFGASLLAARKENFRTAEQDITNIRHNLLSARAGTSAAIMLSKSRSSAAITSGIFEIAGQAFGASADAALLKKKKTTGGGSSG
jgi:hypothetical protein